MTVYTVANHKGGVGKTATAAELTWRLATDGRRVLAVDLDQQGQLGARLGIDATTDLRGTLSDVLRADATIAAAATASPHQDRIHVLHGTADLKDVEKDVTDLPTALRDTLPTAVDDYDDVVIDTPGDIGDLLICGLAAADLLIVAASTTPEAVEQLEVFQTEAVDRVARRMNRDLRISWILPTLHSGSARACRNLEDLHAAYPGQVAPPIGRYDAIPASFDYGAPVSLYRPKSHAAAAYRAALDTILGGTR